MSTTLRGQLRACFLDSGLHLKQLPPATDNPPFVATDAALPTTFRFRVLRENRRPAKADDKDDQHSLDVFHNVLNDISLGHVAKCVKQFSWTPMFAPCHHEDRTFL